MVSIHLDPRTTRIFRMDCGYAVGANRKVEPNGVELLALEPPQTRRASRGMVQAHGKAHTSEIIAPGPAGVKWSQPARSKQNFACGHVIAVSAWGQIFWRARLPTEHGIRG